MPVDLVLPCLNEAAALPWILERLPAGVRAIVVDNGSTDGSPEIAARLGATVVPCELKGYGAACHAGLEAAESDVVAVMDADASLDPQQLSRVTAPVLADRADLVVGRRRPVTRGTWAWHLRLANLELSRRIRRRTGVALHDLGPMRAGRRTALLELGLTDRRSGYPLETVVRAADAGWRIAEVDVDYLPRSGRSKVTGTPLGAARAVLDMSKVLAR
ncbi:glycosyltransferase family 2 protein [Kribbella pratensis]|jgi:glycosyltransferase involved in cell wall biosynthesis|uniref:Glycosyl transferase family 2 n=1 Tax=Kribbella pratensis TaxID=2512112 RepID=A0A4R8CNP8_9ACTN|nr:glycosyltransferase family 2 protein [Kribbella pratensis]TDW77756.1 glycosyl transferase family 2 [Kribbella pratensis]